MELKHPIPLSVVLRECEALLGGDVAILESFDSLSIHSFDSPEHSRSGSLTFLRPPIRQSVLKNLKAAFVFWEGKEHLTSLPGLKVSSIYECMRLLGVHFESEFKYPDFSQVTSFKENASTNIHSSATVLGEVHPSVEIGPFCYVGRHSCIGEGTVLEPRVTIYDGCEIGPRCHLQSGAVIGSAGFGFYQYNGEVRHLPHYAGVVLGEQVWVGANTVIAGGVFNPTRIGNYTKLDSLVQIAHNVEIGERGFIAAKVGIAGSTKIGDRVKIGGAAGINGHICLGNNVTIAALAGVTKDWEGPITLSGFPAQPIREWKKQMIQQRRSGPGIDLPLESHDN